MIKKNCTPKRGKIIEIDEGQVRAHDEELVRSSVELRHTRFPPLLFVEESLRTD